MSFFSNMLCNWLGKDGDTLPPSASATPASSTVDGDTETSRKRTRASVSTPPTLREVDEDASPRPIKLFRGSTRVIPIARPAPIECLPDDLLQRCLSFVGTTDDRFAVQTTCKQFQRLSNGDESLRMVDVETIILETDTVESASRKLTRFAKAGNLKALYMLGIIGTYSHCNVEHGIACLKEAANRGYIRASYACGLVLRDSEPTLAAAYMDTAAQAKYLPALQELLSSDELKIRHGEPGAEELRDHMDPVGLNRLLARHYCNSQALRKFHTSHCWNPLCGRWAFRGRSKNRVSRMKMCSRCCRAKYCSKLCQVYDWRSGRHKLECQFL